MQRPMIRMINLIGACVACLACLTAGAQTPIEEPSAADWNGIWLAQGTLFSVAVNAGNSEFRVEEVQSLGFLWTSEPGSVNADLATFQVTYAGATATLQAQLTGDDVAVVEAINCVPEYMVVCALAKGQTALFIRQGE